MLRKLSCDHAQGYYFSAPMPADKATEFIRAAVAPRKRAAHE
jgi:EAL domain-containing protein (putative c-di-GMP-specific phosphodiesterase class I)